MASATAGMAIRAIHPPGSVVKSGSAPDAGNQCSMEENNRIISTASQNDGVAMHAMENTRITWSGHRSRYNADITPRMVEKITAMIRPINVSCRVTGSAEPIRSDTDMLLAP